MLAWPKLVRAGVWTLLLTIPVYVAGLIQSPLLVPRSTTEICGTKPLADPPVQGGLLPLQFRCMRQDGTSTDMVPAGFNQLLLLIVGLAAILFLLAMWKFLRPASSHTPERT
jgi:hypothetical protein